MEERTMIKILIENVKERALAEEMSSSFLSLFKGNLETKRLPEYEEPFLYFLPQNPENFSENFYNRNSIFNDPGNQGYQRDCEERISELDNQISGLREKNEDLNKELNKLEDEAKKKILSLKAQLETTNEFIEYQTRQREYEIADARSVAQRLDTASRRIYDFQKENGRLKDEISELEEDSHCLTRSNEDLLSKIASLKRDANKKISSLEEDLEDLHSTIKEKEKKIIEYKEGINKLKNENEALILQDKERLQTEDESRNYYFGALSHLQEELQCKSIELEKSQDKADSLRAQLLNMQKPFNVSLKDQESESVKSRYLTLEETRREQVEKDVEPGPSRDHKSDPTFDEFLSNHEHLSALERRTRIAFLENQQAELETKINLLRAEEASKETSISRSMSFPPPPPPIADCQISRNEFMKMDGGMGGEPSGPKILCRTGPNFEKDLDDFSETLVNRMLDRVLNEEENSNSAAENYDDDEEEEEEEEEDDEDHIPDLQSIQEGPSDFMRELQEALTAERSKCLLWMERHNLERDERHILSLEVEELNGKLRKLLKESNEFKDEIQQLKGLYDSEQSRVSVLENALQIEKENFKRIVSNLDFERKRCRQTDERNSEIITGLRTNLEIERERRTNLSKNRPFFRSLDVMDSGLDYSSTVSTSGHTFRSTKPLFVGPHEDPYSPSESEELRRLRRELRDEKCRVGLLKSIVTEQGERRSSEKSENLTVLLDNLHLSKVEEEARKRLEEEIDYLKNQLRIKSTGQSFEQSYIKELEEKIQSYRGQEFELREEISRANFLIDNLRSENETLVLASKGFYVQRHHHQPQRSSTSPGCVDPRIPSSGKDQCNSNSLHLELMNESLHDQIKLLNNRITRLQSEIEDQNGRHPEHDKQPLCKSHSGEIARQTNPNTMTWSKEIGKGNYKEYYLKYLRAEHHRKSLSWQKKYLLLLLRCGKKLEPTPDRSKMAKPYNKFRIASHVIIATFRLTKFAYKWQKRTTHWRTRPLSSTTCSSKLSSIQSINSY